MTKSDEKPLKKVCIICAKGTIEDVYSTLVMANGAVMEGIEAKVFFTFFRLDAITKKQMKNLHTGTVGNPAMRMPAGILLPGEMKQIALLKSYNQLSGLPPYYFQPKCPVLLYKQPPAG